MISWFLMRKLMEWSRAVYWGFSLLFRVPIGKSDYSQEPLPVWGWVIALWSSKVLSCMKSVKVVSPCPAQMLKYQCTWRKDNKSLLQALDQTNQRSKSDAASSINSVTEVTENQQFMALSVFFSVYQQVFCSHLLGFFVFRRKFVPIIITKWACFGYHRCESSYQGSCRSCQVQYAA